jgi:hypothetical protein
MSFIDIEPLRTIGIPSALKMEIIFPQGHILKLETASGWESVGAFIRDLVG